jgi:hypothetical protein
VANWLEPIVTTDEVGEKGTSLEAVGKLCISTEVGLGPFEVQRHHRWSGVAAPLRVSGSRNISVLSEESFSR